ncbi:MAG: rhomboid family intramembrane serine protease [Spirochaetota bacterium]
MFFPLRDENPTRTFPFITILFILLNSFIFFIQLGMGRYNNAVFIAKYGVIPFEITHGVDLNPRIGFTPYVTLITSLFLHGSFWHLLGNMWFLWIFGNNIEDTVGHFRFVLFYLLGGIVASLLQIFVTSSSTTPIVGASGAISAVLGAYMLKFPRARVRTLMFIFIFITVVNVPAITFIGIWFFIQLLSSLSWQVSNVAWFAHIGGFLFGLFTVKLFEKKERYRHYRVY